MTLKEINWGDDSAENDTHLLSYFVDTESLARLMSRTKSIVIGRKGSGKSALRKKLESEFSASKDTYVVNIAPKYASIRNILNEESLNNGFGEEIFFQHSWIRQIILDCLCKIGHDAQGSFTSGSLAYARETALSLGRTSKDIVENIADILSKVKMKAGTLGDLGLQLEKELRSIADVDSLEHHLSTLMRDGAHFVVMIDDLDLGWDNSNTSNNLLLGLLLASQHMKTISNNMHVLIFLREDVYSILMEKTQHSDKYRNVEKIKWSKENLISMLEERIKFNFSDSIDPQQNIFEIVFPATISTHNTDNWLVERTLSRPRELLQLSRIYTEALEGNTPDAEILKNCESDYSSWKLDDLCTEYSNQFPNLSDVFSYWKTKFFRCRYHIKKDDIEQMIFQIFNDVTINQPWFNKLVHDVDFKGFLNILYEIGFIGDFVLGGDGGSKTFYSYRDRHEPRFEEIQIHPCFRKAVNTVDRIRN